MSLTASDARNLMTSSKEVVELIENILKDVRNSCYLNISYCIYVFNESTIKMAPLCIRKLKELGYNVSRDEYNPLVIYISWKDFSTGENSRLEDPDDPGFNYEI